MKELKEYEVWMQGYSCNEAEAAASLVGKVVARSFKQACHILMCQNYLDEIKKVNDPDYKQYFNPDRWDYEPYRGAYWGCKLFDNETDARKAFG